MAEPHSACHLKKWALDHVKSYKEDVQSQKEWFESFGPEGIFHHLAFGNDMVVGVCWDAEDTCHHLEKTAMKEMVRLVLFNCTPFKPDGAYDVNSIRNPHYKNDTLLHQAARMGSLELVAYLLNMGADPTITNDQGLAPVDVICTRVPIYKLGNWKDDHDLYLHLKVMNQKKKQQEHDHGEQQEEECGNEDNANEKKRKASSIAGEHEASSLVPTFKKFHGNSRDDFEESPCYGEDKSREISETQMKEQSSPNKKSKNRFVGALRTAEFYSCQSEEHSFLFKKIKAIFEAFSSTCKQ